MTCAILTYGSLWWRTIHCIQLRIASHEMGSIRDGADTCRHSMVAENSHGNAKAL